MSLYSISLFVHVVGVLLLTALLTLEGITMRTGAAAARLNRILGPVSLVAILVPGFYMAAQSGWKAWTAVGLVSYVLIAALGTYSGIRVTRGRMRPGPTTLSWLVRTGLALGVVFDMTVKPDAIVSIAAVVLAAILATAAAVPAMRLARTA